MRYSPAMPRVLHVLAQRPSLTGSGVTLDALVRTAHELGWEQRVVAGIPGDAPHPEVGGLPADSIDPLRFEATALPFALPGMSDVMPYPSSVWSTLGERELDLYRLAWRDHLVRVLEDFRPDVIHSHHVWILSSMVKDLAPSTPVLTHCHATGLRQMELCPHLAPEVVRGCRRNDRFAVLHEPHSKALAAALDIPRDRIHTVGAGYREDLFAPGSGELKPPDTLLYVGKYARSKGLPWLLNAFERLLQRRPGLRLHVAGSGAGDEAEGLRTRMRALAPAVTLHGQLGQEQLAELMARSTVCVLPSFYEGLPLVLVEALACGCRLVATSLPGVVEAIAPSAGRAIEVVELPRLRGPDTPEPSDLPAFTDRLEAALDRSLEGAGSDLPAPDLSPFTWRAVTERVEVLWRALLEDGVNRES